MARLNLINTIQADSAPLTDVQREAGDIIDTSQTLKLMPCLHGYQLEKTGLPEV